MKNGVAASLISFVFIAKSASMLPLISMLGFTLK